MSCGQVIRGNPDTETGRVTARYMQGSPRADMLDPACLPVRDSEGPGVGGCLLDTRLYRDLR